MLTLAQAIQARGLPLPKPRTVKQVQAAFARQKAEPRTIPNNQWFAHQYLIARQDPTFTLEAPDCIGDPQQFSSSFLTQQYVAEFCRLNHLKH